MTTPNNLPAELTSFVGREPQLAELRRLLHRSRLITLTGPGGAGKTRLAVRLAAESVERYPDGVWLLDLAPIGDGRLVEQTVAGLSGIKDDPRRPILDVLADGLADRRLLFVLDGCEHLVDTCAELTGRLLRSCPKLTILATSREPLGVTGEVIWRTPSLTTPRLDDAGHPELLMESEAIRLFVDRAQLSRPDFALQASNAAPLAQICTRLEGIPLAIELAAGLASVMTLQEILERLRHRFQLLTGGSRTALPRHQTLRQAVDWSYGLLSPTEQALFVRLGVFAGGFDLPGAEAVVAGDGIAVDDVLPILTRLVHKSLVVAEPSRPDATRYRMLDTIREYAAEKQLQSGEADWRRRHADYFAQWAAHATRQLGGLEQVLWLRRLDEEQGNLRIALEWSLSEQPDTALRLVAEMGTYWWMRRRLSEGIDWLSRALDVKASNRELRARALVARARLSRRRGDYASAARAAEEAASIARELGLGAELSRAVTMLGIISSHAGDLSVTLKHFNEATDIAERLGDRERIASGLNNIAMVESALGRQELALTHAEAAAVVAEEMGDRFLRANILDTVGRIHFRLGNYEIARRSWAEALTTSLEFEDTMNIADGLDGVALLALTSGDAHRCLVLVGAAEAMRAITAAERTREWAAEIEERVTKSTAKLGRAGAEAARRQGSAMTMYEAVRFALGVSIGNRRDGTTRLTDREIQVARLVSEGLTNGEVAKRLKISYRTVDAHVEHIRNKLGLRTRAQIAVWAHERLGRS